MYNLYVTYIAEDTKSIHDFYDEVKSAGIIAASRNEEGNLCYEYYFSAERENQLLLIEKWKSEEAQQHHATLPHFAQLGKIKAKYKVETSIEK